MILLVSPASATSKSWLPSSGTWNDNSHWSGNAAPASTTDATIDNGGSVLVPTAVSGAARDLYLGNSNSGTLIISGGSIANSNSYLGYGQGSSGSATVSSGTWSHSSWLIVGNSGTGTLNVEGGTVLSNTGYIGSNGDSIGTATLSGGTWSSQSLCVGHSGNGTLNLEKDGVVSVQGGAGNLDLAEQDASTGILNLGTGASAGTLRAASVTGGAGAATVNFNHTGGYTFAPQLSGTLTVNQLGSGTTVLTGSSNFTGAANVSAGRLEVNGSLSAASPVSVHIGATLAGSGRVRGTVAVNGTLEGTLTTGAISGSGLISPGNSPGILTADSVEISTGIDFAFEFTLPDSSPIYSAPTASGNDLLLLTGATPFSGDLTTDNTIRIYLKSAAAGTTYLGGFFTGLSATALETAVKNAQFEFYVEDELNGTISFNGKKYTPLSKALLSLGATYVTNAAFLNGITEGSELTLAVLPEPGAWALLIAGMGALAFARRKKCCGRKATEM
ncbi:MAG: PEP-CTERM sorting domain-containing protein [Chthoniobacteraceae bacterium]|nr:PEP-CTERM sorting domain-containing protein [Chthoniobacteraceae bacterium]